MTAIVGILCKDGVVVGTDSSTTFTTGSSPTIEQESRKISILNDRFILAGTGAVGLSQRFHHEVEKYIEPSANRDKDPIEICCDISKNVLENLIATKAPAQLGMLFAFPSKKKNQRKKACLCEFDSTSLQPELKSEKIWYVSLGSGQFITDTFLGFIRKIFWNDGMPDLTGGIFAALWTLQMAVKLNPGGINGPIDIATLSEESGELKARILSEAEIVEHSNTINALEKHISDFKHDSVNNIIPPPEPPQ